MCGRFALRNPQQVKEKLTISTSVEPRYNIAPGQKVLVTDNNVNLMFKLVYKLLKIIF